MLKVLGSRLLCIYDCASGDFYFFFSGFILQITSLNFFSQYIELKYCISVNLVCLVLISQTACPFSMQIIQVPQGKYKVLPPERTKTGPYPVSLIPGQFQEYYKRCGDDDDLISKLALYCF